MSFPNHTANNRPWCLDLNLGRWDLEHHKCSLHSREPPPELANPKGGHFSNERGLYMNLYFFPYKNLMQFTDLYKATKYCINYPKRWEDDYWWKSLTSKYMDIKMHTAQWILLNHWMKKLPVWFPWSSVKELTIPFIKKIKHGSIKVDALVKSSAVQQEHVFKRNKSFTNNQSVPK